MTFRSLLHRGVRFFQDSRQILRALTFHLMELHTSKEFRQCSITDSVVYGRKLRAWQVWRRRGLVGGLLDLSHAPHRTHLT